MKCAVCNDSHNPNEDQSFHRVTMGRFGPPTPDEVFVCSSDCLKRFWRDSRNNSQFVRTEDARSKQERETGMARVCHVCCDLGDLYRRAGALSSNPWSMEHDEAQRMIRLEAEGRYQLMAGGYCSLDCYRKSNELAFEDWSCKRQLIWIRERAVSPSFALNHDWMGDFKSMIIEDAYPYRNDGPSDGSFMRFGYTFLEIQEKDLLTSESKNVGIRLYRHDRRLLSTIQGGASLQRELTTLTDDANPKVASPTSMDEWCEAYFVVVIHESGKEIDEYEYRTEVNIRILHPPVGKTMREWMRSVHVAAAAKQLATG